MKNIHLLCCMFLFVLALIKAQGNQRHPLQLKNKVIEAFHQGLANARYAALDDGKELRYTHFSTPHQEKQGTLIFVQGRGTFLEYHETFFSEFLLRGYDIWTYDLLGQGLSTHLVDDDPDNAYEYRKQYIEDFSVYMANLDDFLHKYVHPIPSKPLILGGYSTGAHILMRYLQTYPVRAITGAFAISPIINYTAGFFTKQLVKVMAYLTPQEYTLGYGPEDPIFQTEFESNGYTGDEAGYWEIVDLVQRHPQQASVGGSTWGWVQASMNSCIALKSPENLQKISTPLAVFSGLSDTIVDNSRNLEILHIVSKIQYFEYPEGRHELFRETPHLRSQLWNDIDYFLSSLPSNTTRL